MLSQEQIERKLKLYRNDNLNIKFLFIDHFLLKKLLLLIITFTETVELGTFPIIFEPLPKVFSMSSMGTLNTASV